MPWPWLDLCSSKEVPLCNSIIFHTHHNIKLPSRGQLPKDNTCTFNLNDACLYIRKCYHKFNPQISKNGMWT